MAQRPWASRSWFRSRAPTSRSRAQRLLGMEERHHLIERVESNLVGRQWEMSAVEGLLHRAIDGHGAVVGVVGPPGIGKSRLVREVAAMASDRSVEVFTAFCESHTSQVPFRAVARLLRAAFGVGDLDAQAARDRVRDRLSDPDPEDLMLLDDLLAIADPDTALPKIDPGCASATADSPGECRLVGPPNPGGLCR